MSLASTNSANTMATSISSISVSDPAGKIGEAFDIPQTENKEETVPEVPNTKGDAKQEDIKTQNEPKTEDTEEKPKDQR